MIMSQLALAIRLPDLARFSTYFAGPNGETVSYLRRFAAQPVDRVAWLRGTTSVGKTHLLQAVCHEAGSAGMRVAYLPMKEISAFDSDILGGWEGFDVLCADDIDSVIGRRQWEVGLFELFNRIHETGGRWLAAAEQAPGGLPFVLPDLRSRMGWGPVYELKPLGDEERIEALQLRARQRGLELPQETGQFLLRRYPRGMGALFRLLDTLDEASMAAQRRLTVPFVKSVIGEAEGVPDAESP